MGSAHEDDGGDFAARDRRERQLKVVEEDVVEEDAALTELIPLPPDAIEHAILSGSCVRQLEHERSAAVSRALRSLEALLKKCATSSGGFRGQGNHRIDGSIAIPITGTSKESIHIHAQTGMLKNCYTSGALHAVWRVLPKIFDDHIKACGVLVTSVAVERDAAMTMTRNIEIIEALLDSPISVSQKRELVEKAFHNEDVKDAMAAAEATGESDAVAKLIRDQAGVVERPADEVVAIADVTWFVEQDIQNVIRHEADLDPIVITFETTGRASFGWTIDQQRRAVTPGVRSSADGQLKIDFTTLHRLLTTSDEAEEGFMRAYFAGKLRICGDPMMMMGLTKILGTARHQYVERRQCVAEC